VPGADGSELTGTPVTISFEEIGDKAAGTNLNFEPRRLPMYRFIGLIAAAVITATALPSAQQPSGGGPYKIVKSARVGGEGGWDYITPMLTRAGCISRAARCPRNRYPIA